MSSGDLVDGIRWVLANCKDENGKPFNQSSLSVAAGLSRSHVGLILRGNVKPESLQLDTINKIAAAAGVTPEFLKSGGTNPGSPIAAHTASSASSSKAVVLAMAGRMPEAYSEAALAGLEATPEPGDDPGREHWWQLLREYEDRVRQERARYQPEPPMPPRLAEAIRRKRWHGAAVEHALSIARAEGDRSTGRWVDLMDAYEKEHRHELEAQAEAEREPPERSGNVVKGGRRKKA